MDIQAILEGAFKVIIPLAFTLAAQMFRQRSIVYVGKRSRTLAEMEFLTSFLSFDLSHRPRIIVEQAFAVHFNSRFDFDQIMAVMNFLNPYRSFRLLRTSKDVVVINDSSIFEYVKGYEKESNRLWKKGVNFGLYFIFLLIPFYAFMFKSGFDKTEFWLANEPFRMTVYIMAGVMVFFAFDRLNAAINIENAEDFMNEQDKTLKAALKKNAF